MNRRAQMEMIGLVVIVILITLGLLFLAQFALKEKPEKKIFTRKGLAYSGMSALLKTTVKPGVCGAFQPSLEAVLKDCALYFPPQSSESLFQCFSLQGQGEQNFHSCYFFKEEATELLDKTLGLRLLNKNYEFHSRLVRLRGEQPDHLVDINTGSCPNERDTSGLFPIQAGDAGLIENELYVCD